MSPINKNKLKKLRKSLDKLDNSFIKLVKKRTSIVKQVLKLNDIKCVSVNKIDSSYNNFGYYEVLVVEKNYLKAQKLIQELDFYG